MAKKLTTEDFIRKARLVHGNKYDYSKIEYVNIRTKIIIICPEHGEFKQTPNGHLLGKGCSKCAGQSFKYITLDEVKKIIKPLGIKSEKEYCQWWKKNENFCRENGIPRSPDQYYRKHK